MVLAEAQTSSPVPTRPSGRAARLETGAATRPRIAAPPARAPLAPVRARATFLPTASADPMERSASVQASVIVVRPAAGAAVRRNTVAPAARRLSATARPGAAVVEAILVAIPAPSRRTVPAPARRVCSARAPFTETAARLAATAVVQLPTVDQVVSRTSEIARPRGTFRQTAPAVRTGRLVRDRALGTAAPQAGSAEARLRTAELGASPDSAFVLQQTTFLRTAPAEATGRRARGLPLATAARPAAFVERRRTTAARAVKQTRALVLVLPITTSRRTAAAARTARSARARPLATAAPLAGSAARLRTIVVPAVKPPLAHAQRLVRTTSPLMDPAGRTARPVKGPRSVTAARRAVSVASQRITAGRAARLYSARVRPGLVASRPMVRVGRMERRARARLLEIAARLPGSVASRQITVVPVVNHRSAPARPVPAPCLRMEAAARTARRVRDRHLETAVRRTVSAESLQTIAARAARGLLERATARPTVSPRTAPVVRGTARRASGPGLGRAAPALDIAEALEATAARAGMFRTLSCDIEVA